MGYYTTLQLAIELKTTTPRSVREILDYMALGRAELNTPVPTGHPLFETERWNYMLRSGPYAISKFEQEGGGAFLFCYSYFKDYEGEISKFLDWLGPWIVGQPGAFLGYCQGEDEEQPRLLYKKGTA